MKLIVNPSAQLRGVMAVPGDKSISHRVLMHAALANGDSRIEGCLQAGVTEAMIGCLRQLNIKIESDPAGALIIQGGHWRSPAAMLDCGNSGATMRMLLGALAGQSQLRAILTGSPGLRRRPMKRVIDPLLLMGADIQEEMPPLLIQGRSLHGVEYDLPVASAQVKAALLLAALQADGLTRLHEPGPSRDHSERLLRALNVPLIVSDHSIQLEPLDRPLPPFEISVPGDLSSAAFLLAAAALCSDSEMTLQAVGVNPTRTGLLDALSAMGAEIEIDRRRDLGCEPVADVTIRSSELRGITIEGEQVVRMIDEFPMLAVIATQAQGETIVREAAELHVKESDRIGTLAAELRKLGARIEEQADGFVIEGPTQLHGAVLDSQGDHRLAMSLAVAGLIAEGETTILNAEAYHESFPNFVELLRQSGANLAEG
jgi:3-phosphoshikimate 1-carboxyvinyltransferase